MGLINLVELAISLPIHHSLTHVEEGEGLGRTGASHYPGYHRTRAGNYAFVCRGRGSMLDSVCVVCGWTTGPLATESMFA